MRIQDFEEDEVPSDSESINEDFMDSEDEESLCQDVLSEESDIEPDALERESDEGSDSDDDTPLSIRLSNMDGIWERKRRRTTNKPFVEHTGPKNIPDNVKSPGVFLCLFSETNVNSITDQSNLYCRQQKKEFTDITPKEIKKFIGVNMMMGIKRLPSYRDYWSSNVQLNDPYVSSTMTVKRFSFLLSSLHLNDSSKEPKRNKDGYDKLYKVRPFLDNLSETYMRFYDPTRDQAVDESMIKFKGRSSMKQYLPMKPVPRGFKSWVRADHYGYVCEFQIYTGKVHGRPERFLGERVVRELTRTLVNKNYRIHFDNFFTTVDLMSSLLVDGILACGTVRKNRKDLPKLQSRDKEMSHGDSEFRTSYKGIQWVKWIDKKPVHFLTNFQDASIISETERKQKDGTLKVVSCPIVAKVYNTYMGCVDKADAMKNCYQISRKSKKWWHRIFWHFVDVTLVNSFILYKLSFPQQTLSLKDFRLSVVDHLLGFPDRPKRGRPSSELPTRNVVLRVPESVRTAQRPHFPGTRETRHRCAYCSSKANEKRTKFYCKTCNVPLCIDEQNNCYEKFHLAKTS